MLKFVEFFYFVLNSDIFKSFSGLYSYSCPLAKAAEALLPCLVRGIFLYTMTVKIPIWFHILQSFCVFHSHSLPPFKTLNNFGQILFRRIPVIVPKTIVKNPASKNCTRQRIPCKGIIFWEILLIDVPRNGV